MISVSEAKNIIREHSKRLDAKLVTLQDATGLVLAEDVFAEEDFPNFRQSAMDGYAFDFAQWKAGGALQIIGEAAAGKTEKTILQKNQAIRIFTGAPLPEGADTVVMQEKISINGTDLIIQDEKLKPGSHVRQIGSEIKCGDKALQADTFLSASAIGFLAAIGKTKVSAYPCPRVAIVVTGNELKSPGTTLQHGQVNESNAITLSAALQQIHIDNIHITHVADNLSLIEKALQQAISNADLVLVTGGVSVGDYDFVATALERSGVQKHFHRVKQKPGKPLYFGTSSNTLIFGLPGNPSSALTCFYEYVLIALQSLKGLSEPYIKPVRLPLAADYTKPAGLTHFLKGTTIDNQAMPLSAQESYRLRSFAVSNCLIVLDEIASELKKGDLVEVHFLPK